NGDLFDFWFEYGAVIPRRHFATVAKLHALRAKGVAITLVGGNHDRWGGDFLTEDLGIGFHGGEAEILVAGRRAFVAHGDGLTEQHWSAKLMHRVTRHPVTVRVFRALHPDLGFWIAHRLSGTLADHTRDSAVLAREQPSGLELPRDDLRGLLGGVHERDVRTHDTREQRLQQRVVRAAEYQRFDAGTPQRLQVLAGDELGRRVIEPAFFHERHEQGAGPGVNARARADRGDGPLIGAAGDRARSPDDADRPRSGRLHRRARAGLDHADERHRRALLQVGQRLRGDRIARHDQRLHAALQQVGEDLRRVAAHGVR